MWGECLVEAVWAALASFEGRMAVSIRDLHAGWRRSSLELV